MDVKPMIRSCGEVAMDIKSHDSFIQRGTVGDRGLRGLGQEGDYPVTTRVILSHFNASLTVRGKVVGQCP